MIEKIIINYGKGSSINAIKIFFLTDYIKLLLFDILSLGKKHLQLNVILYKSDFGLICSDSAI